MAAKTIVLLGIGHTNAHVVKQWAKRPIDNCRLVCVSKFSTATYSGMLPGTLGLQFGDDEMRIDLVALAAAAEAELVLASANGLSLETGELLFEDHDPIRFDAVSVGVGSMPIGWQQHCESDSFVPIKPMQTFQSRLEQRLAAPEIRTAESSPRIAIVGGGVASVEIALCLQQLLRRTGRESFRLDIFTASDRVADGMTDRSVGLIEQILQQRSIGVIPQCRIHEVRQQELVDDHQNVYRADAVIWATGAAPPPVLASLGLSSDARGFMATAKTLQSVSDPRVFAVGDCGTVVESPAPKAGVYAVRQCPVLWHNLNAFLCGDALKEFHPQSDFLKLLNTGDGKAVLQYRWFSTHAAWCWHLKTWIDKRFVAEFQSL